MRRNFSAKFADFRPLIISRENGSKKFDEKSLTFSTVHHIMCFFSLLELWELGATPLSKDRSDTNLMQLRQRLLIF